MTIRLGFAAITAAALVTAASAASAERAWLGEVEAGTGGVRSVDIDLSDIDLATADGPAILWDRVRIAASIICGGRLPDDVLYGQEARARKACRRDTVRSVENQASDLVSLARSGNGRLALSRRDAPTTSVD